MKRFFKRIDKQFFWLFGKTISFFFQFEFRKMMEGIYILRIHLSHDHIEIHPSDEENILEEENSEDNEKEN